MSRSSRLAGWAPAIASWFPLVAFALAVSAPSAHSAIRIEEFGIRCSNGQPQTAFVELSGTIDDHFEARIGLQFLDASGQTIADVRPIWGTHTGSYFYYRTRFLVCASRFSEFNGGGGDANLSFDPDPVRGRVVLYRLAADNVTRTPLHQLAYGGPGEAPAPPAGATLVRTGASTFTVSPEGTPSGYFADHTENSCYRLPRWSVTELALGCWDGDARGQFVEIRSDDLGGFCDPSYRLALFDRNGVQTGELANPFGSRSGSAVPAGTPFLITGPGWPGPTSDAVLPAALDTEGGRVELRVQVAGLTLVTSSFAWGGTSPLPPAGTSLEASVPDGSPAISLQPSPSSYVDRDQFLAECFYRGAQYPAADVGEIALACEGGSPAGQFVEVTLRANPVTEDPRIRVRVYDHQGLETGESPMFDGLSGRVIAPDSKWLLASETFASVTGSPPDRVLPLSLDPTGGTVELRVHDVLSGQSMPIASLSYGARHPQGLLPGPGQSLVHNLVGPRYMDFVTSAPTPQLSSGPLLIGNACFPDADVSPVRISGVLTRCRNGEPLSLVELTPTDGTIASPSMRIRIRDHRGAVLAEEGQLFPNLPEYTPWPAGRSLLLGRPFASGETAGMLDGALPALLDPEGGEIELLSPNPGHGGLVVVHRVRYGTPDVTAPEPGQSLQRAPNDTWSVQEVPAFETFLGASIGVAYSSCFGRCPLPAWRASDFQQQVLANATGDVFDSFSRMTFDATQPRLFVSLRPVGRLAEGYLADRYVVTGAPDGTPVRFGVRWRFTTLLEDDEAFYRPQAYFQSRTEADSAAPPYLLESLTTGTREFTAELVQRAGIPFEIGTSLTLLTHPFSEGGARSELVLSFEELPLTAGIQSCWGFELAPPVAAEITLAEASVAEGVARLRWFAAGARPRVEVERALPGEAWQAAGSVAADGDGFYAFEDPGLAPGARVGYRLAWTEAGARRTTAETWLDVPSTFTFALRGVRPHPLAGAGVLAFALDRAGDVRVDVFDIAGRRVLERRWTLGPGEHVMPLAREGELRPGLYAIRMRHGGRALTTRAIVVR